jgi:DNA processing protein
MDELPDWLTLWHVPGIGPVTFHALLERFETPANVFKASRERLKACRLSERSLEAIRHPGQEGVERDLEWASEPNHTILMVCDSNYPERLREIPSPPPVLYVNGDPTCLSDPQLAMVGSRNPTAIGTETARDFACHLARKGLIITSGLALGIDSASHRGALDCDGMSVAVAATGLDRVYPARHRTLAHLIADRGAIVSEFPIGTPPKAEHFPRRNRIISGLSLGTLIVEATRRSGSLITARCATEQGREVFAIPGSIHNPMARGCHWLIKQGAKLVQTADDILEELTNIIDVNDTTITAPEERIKPSQKPQKLDGEYQKLLDLLGYEPTSIDVLVERSGLTVEEVSSMLLILELKDLVKCGTGGLYIRLTMENINERISD